MTDAIKRGEDLLTKILSFYPRADARGSTLLAVNTGLLALLSANTPPLRHFQEWYMFLPIVPIILIGISFWHLYRSAFPQLEGGHSSVIYFREIARRTESNYINEFKALSD